jgi:hypothetical protein
MIRAREVYKFKKGQKLSLDSIYVIQGLADGNWWEKEGGDDMSENIICTDNIKITIIVERENPYPAPTEARKGE